jgi:divalent metal cation (Fe/Co/Zn/Cd) transporter
MILLAAWSSPFRAIEVMIKGPDTQKLDVGLVLIAVAGAINGAVGLGLLPPVASAGRSRSSPTGSTCSPTRSPAVAVLAALLIMWLKPAWTWVDPIAALCVAGYIAVMGLGLVSHSTAGLMDRQDAADDRLLRDILDAHVNSREPRICSYHKLRHRHSGRYHWVDFHIMVPATWDIRRGHEVASAIEYEIEQALGEGNARPTSSHAPTARARRATRRRHERCHEYTGDLCNDHFSAPSSRFCCFPRARRHLHLKSRARSSSTSITTAGADSRGWTIAWRCSRTGTLAS